MLDPWCEYVLASRAVEAEETVARHASDTVALGSRAPPTAIAL